MNYKSFPSHLARELTMTTVLHIYHDRGALCEKQEHEQSQLMIQDEASFWYCLCHLIGVEHSALSLAATFPLEAKNGKIKQHALNKYNTVIHADEITKNQTQSVITFQTFSIIDRLMSTHLSRVYKINYPCTWTLVPTCPCRS